MLKRKIMLLGLTAAVMLSGCQEELVEKVEAPEQDSGTPKEQIADLQKDFTEIIAEADSEHGKLVFYSLENDNKNKGVGLAVFNEEDGDWVYSVGTSHSVSVDSETIAFPSDRIELSDKVKVVYGYLSDSPIEKIQEVNSEKLADNKLEVSESVISYTFVSPDQDITVLPN